MSKKIKITLIRSINGKAQIQRKVLKGMGLTKIGKKVELEDTPAIRGMIDKVSHLVKVEGKTDGA